MSGELWSFWLARRRFCLTLVTASEPMDVYSGFGGFPADTREMTAEQTQALRDEQPEGEVAPIVRVGSCGEGTFVVEDGSAQGARHTVLCRVSQAGRAVAVSLTPDDLPRLRWYEGGQPAAELILSAPHRITGPQERRLASLLKQHDAALAARGHDHRALIPLAVSIAAELTGVCFDITLLRQPLLGGLVLPLLDEPPTPAPLPSHLVTATLAAADELAVRAALTAQARRLVDEYELDAYPPVRELADALPDVPRSSDFSGSPLGLLLRRLTSPHHRSGLTPKPKPSIQLRRAWAALHAIARLPARQALAEVFMARRPNPTTLDELRHDLEYPRIDPALLDNLQENERASTAHRSRARRAAQHLDGPLPALTGPDAAWNWLLTYLPQGLSLTFAQGLTPAALLERLSADPRTLTTPAHPWTPTEQAPVAAAGQLDAWAFALEAGPKPISSHLFTNASAGTRIIHLQHPGTGPNRFSYAEDGVLVAQFDTLIPSHRQGRDPDRFVPLLAELHINQDATVDTAPQAVMSLYRLASRVLDARLDHATALQPPFQATLTWKFTPKRGRQVALRPSGHSRAPEAIRAGRAHITPASGTVQRKTTGK